MVIALLSAGEAESALHIAAMRSACKRREQVMFSKKKRTGWRGSAGPLACEANLRSSDGSGAGGLKKPSSRQIIPSRLGVQNARAMRRTLDRIPAKIWL